MLQGSGHEPLLLGEELHLPGPDEASFLVGDVGRLEAEAVLVVGEDPPLGEGGDAGVQVQALGPEGLHAEGGEPGPQGEAHEAQEEGPGQALHGFHSTRPF